MTGATRWIIAGLSGALFLAVVVIVVMAAGGGDDSPDEAQAVLEATPTTAAASTSTPVPSPVPPTPPPPPTELPPPPPEIRTCAEIRADPNYRSDEERAFFLANCPAPTAVPSGQTGQAQAPPPPPPPSGPAPVPCSAESSYVSRGSAAAGAFISRAIQYFGTPSLGAENDILELASITLNFANSLSAIQPVPASCRQAHDRLVGAALEVYDTLRAIELVNSQASFTAWIARYERAVDGLDVALDAWLATTGIVIPNFSGLR